MKRRTYYAHPTAVIDRGATIGRGTKVWHFCHIMSGARVGKNCVLGHNVFVAASVIGDRCRLQNNVSVYEGVELAEEVFVGPSAVFTNVLAPRAFLTVPRERYLATRVGRGVTIGANATIVCGVDIGPYSLIGAGAVITRDVPPHALVTGVPGRQAGWMCRCGRKIVLRDRQNARPKNPITCSDCGSIYGFVNKTLQLKPARQR